ncbi:MAG: filamentous hemagglutinin N-terminal domain-containing protein, partial [Aquabacterium commune]|uniref:beta strand repeat-containing protein n=1 Tax=Aquabacterium commune TaxID=70586 RepID=UPI003BAF89A9
MKSPRRPNPLCPARLTPLALAVAGLAGAAGAAPFTGVQTTDNVQISQQGQTTTLTQTAPVGIVRTEGFGIGATEAVRALQPTAQSTLWIDVTGAARSDILGSLTANGRVLISNPYGIYFGAGAQINVGALVATTLTPQAEGIAQGRILLKDSGVPGGRVVNAGTLKADGTVALVAPQVVNEGVIEAHRVGLAAASEVLVDVEGDGLVFFQLGGAQVAQRLDQLGRITSDGGTVDLRANARAAMADTVLNLDGVVQARSLGQRGGVVYVDGGAQGRTEVKGAVDVSGLDSGERGGRVDITGQQLSVAASARIDARGDAGGGTVHLGGGWQGTGSLAHANRVDVAQGAQIDASAVTLGDGGEVVVWSQGVTRFQGLARARGGAQGGDGGRVEVSGAQLGFQGQVDTAAPLGRTGSLLLDPTDLTVLKVNGQLGANEVDVATLNASTTSVTLQADNSITVQDNIHMTQPGAGLTLNGGASIVLKANILIDDGALSLTATTISLSGKVGQVSDFSLSAKGGVSLLGALTGGGQNLTIDSAGAKSLAAVSGVLNLASTGAGATTLNGDVATSGTQNYGAVTLGNDVTLTSSGAGAAGAITVGGALTGAGKGLTLDSAGAKSLAAVSGVLNLASTGAGVTTLNGNVATTGTQNYGAVTLGNDVTLTSSGTGAAGDITLAGAIAGAGKDLTVQTVGTTAFNANVDGVRNLVTDAGGTTRLAADVRTSGSQTYNDALVVAGTGPRTLEASSIELLGTSLDAGGRDLVLRTDALSTSASLSVANATGRAVTVETRSDGVDILLNHAGTGLSLSTGTLTALRAFASVTLGRGSSASQITAGAFTLPAQLALLSSTGDVTLAGAVTGAGGALRIATAGRAVISGGLSGAASLDVNAGQGTTVSADVATTGSQTYAQRLTLNGGDRVLRAGAFTVQGEFDVAHNNVRIDTDRLDLRGLVRNGSGATLFLASLTPGLGIQLADADPLGGGITPSPLYLSQALLNLVADFSSVHIGRAGFTGAVNAVNLSLPADMVLEGSSVSLSGTTLGQVHRLGLNASTGVTTLQGSLTGVTDLHTDAGGGTEVSGRVAVTGELHFGDAVQLATGAAVTLEADRLTLDQGLNTRGTDLNLRVNAWSVAGGLTHAGIAGRLSIATLSDGRDICLNTSVGCGTALVLDGGLLSQWNVFSSATVGRADSDSAIRANALTLPTDLTLRSGAGDIALAGTTSGAAHLSLDTAGTATLGPVSVQSLSTSVRGTTALGGDVSTVGAQAYGNAVRLNADVQLSAGGVALGATLDANGHDLTVRADAFSLAGSTSGGAGRTVTVSPRTIGGDLWVGLAGPGLSISGIDLARLGGPSGFSEVRLGRIDNAGAVWVEGLALPTDVRLTGTSVVFMGTTALNGYRLDVRTDDFLLIDAFAPGAGELVLSPLFTSGIHLNDGTFTGLFLDQPTLGHLAGIGRLTLGRTDLGTTVTVGQFGTSTTLSSNLRLVGSDVTFVGDLHMNGRALDLWADRLNGLAAPGAGPTVSGLGAVNLASRTAGASIGLASGTGTVRFSQSTVDAFADATVLTVGRAGSDSTVQAAGLTLRTGTVIDAGLGDITFNGTTVGSGKALQLNSGGVTTLGGSIGGLASLATDAPGTTLIGQDVGTSGAQTYLDNATLVNSAAAATFTASALTFGQDLDVNQRDLVVRADSFQVNGATRNADRANLQLTSRTAGRDIFLNTSGTGLTLDNTTLQALALFRTLTIGSSDSGAIAAHDLSLPADLTLISGSHITFTGATVGGGHRLSLRAPGDTLLQGSYSGLLSLSTDAPGSTRLATDVQASESVTVLDRLVLEGAATRKLSAD